MADSVGVRILEILKRNGWSRREIARRAGLAETHVGLILKKFETEPTASLEDKTVRAIANAANVSAAWLQFGVGDPLGADSDSQVQPEVVNDDDETPVYERIPGYSEIEVQAREIDSRVPTWAFEQLRKSNPLRESVVPLTPAAVAALARVIATYGRPPVDVSGPSKNQKK